MKIPLSFESKQTLDFSKIVDAKHTIEMIAGAQAGPPPQAGYGSSWNWNIQQNGSAPPPTAAAAGYPSQGAPHPAAHQGI